MSFQITRLAGLTAFALIMLAARPSATHELRNLVDAFAGTRVASGAAVGVGIAIVRGREPTRFFTCGNAALGPNGPTPFSPDTLFQLGR